MNKIIKPEDKINITINYGTLMILVSLLGRCNPSEGLESLVSLYNELDRLEVNRDIIYSKINHQPEALGDLFYYLNYTLSKEEFNEIFDEVFNLKSVRVREIKQAIESLQEELKQYE